MRKDAEEQNGGENGCIGCYLGNTEIDTNTDADTNTNTGHDIFEKMIWTRQ